MSELAVVRPGTNGIQQQQQPQAIRPMRLVEDNGPLAYLFDTARFEHMQRIAKMLAHATLTPAHLKGETAEQALANCFRVANQAVRWGVDPFAVCDETYVVRGKLGYQGKLVAAIVNTRAGLRGRLTYSYTGQGDGRTITVSGTFDNETEPRTVELSVGQAKTENQMWKKDPDQKLVYSAVTKWARKHCPEVLMGVLTEDDLERMPAVVEGSSPSLQAIIEQGQPRPALQPPPIEAVEVKVVSSDPPAPESPQATREVPASEPAPSGGDERAGPSDNDLAIEAFADEGAQDWTTFPKALTNAAAETGADAIVGETLKKLKVGEAGSAKRSGIDARKKILIAAKSGKFDFGSAAIQA